MTISRKELPPYCSKGIAISVTTQSMLEKPELYKAVHLSTLPSQFMFYTNQFPLLNLKWNL